MSGKQYFCETWIFSVVHKEMYHWPIVGTRCYYFLVQMMSSAKYISSSGRNVVGTDRVALGRPSCSPTSPLRRPRDPCAGYHSPYKAEPLHPNSPALERPSYPLHITFAATACKEPYQFLSLQRISREIAVSPYLAPAHSTIQVLKDVPRKTAPR